VLARRTLQKTLEGKVDAGEAVAVNVTINAGTYQDGFQVQSFFEEFLVLLFQSVVVRLVDEIRNRVDGKLVQRGEDLRAVVVEVLAVLEEGLQFARDERCEEIK
jgi:hypothetical protein